jgi:epoxide hydrolase-like predicted phosphatase
MAHYKAIGFDWGGVINGKPSRYFEQAVIDLTGITKQEYENAYYRHNAKLHRGEITWEHLWELVLSELGYPDNPEMVQQIINLSNRLLSNTMSTVNLNSEVLELIKRLRSNGYKIGLLTNNSGEQIKIMRSQNIDDLFDAIDISSETGFVKPNPEAFKHLASGLDADIADFIFVDDVPKSLSTAEETGFTPILFDDYEQLVKDLEALGVKTD